MSPCAVGSPGCFHPGDELHAPDATFIVCIRLVRLPSRVCEAPGVLGVGLSLTPTNSHLLFHIIRSTLILSRKSFENLLVCVRQLQVRLEV